jgi:CMP-N-acetylneuraminic acid synthetase
MHQTVAALVPMRHHSERVPGKNYRDFIGKPLYHRVIETLLACPLIDKVVIDTDSGLIMDDAARHFPQVELIERPFHLRLGVTSMNEVLLHDVTRVQADWYLQTHSTNPLLRTETVTEALQRLFDALPEYDSLFSVTRIQSRFWDGQGLPLNHDPMVLLRTQDLPPIYEENSNLYLFSRLSLEMRENRIGERPLMFEMDQAEAVDIDEEINFLWAEFLYRDREKV